MYTHTQSCHVESELDCELFRRPAVFCSTRGEDSWSPGKVRLHHCVPVADGYFAAEICVCVCVVTRAGEGGDTASDIFVDHCGMAAPLEPCFRLYA